MAALEKPEERNEASPEERISMEENPAPAEETIPASEEKLNPPAESSAPEGEPDPPKEDYSKKNQEEAYEKLYTEILAHFRSFSPSEQIAGRITEDHITEYLEGNREERREAYKERREKRFLIALELMAVLTAIVLVVWFLRENPAILVNILYIAGGLGALFAWKRPHTDKDKKE